MTQRLYEYLHKVTGNVCTDWRLAHPQVTTFENKHQQHQVVNGKAFKTFIKKGYVDGDPGSCQDAGYTWKQLDFSANVRPTEKRAGMQAFL
eukprot:CAMPEP_0206244168 /NCGR_PEP_ID=MMETSP0047_2-20121206/18007_1 /ASSEMBLY_ACC=CAM_ASM_000192 /TAXON_ID=195065 /ORGANISM="Chroomonas mesostigmatica_cf, Strain CCMP1168" /LENGTH=90 /DNA_ID=CAMNT_0053669357 /DNA_START=53 /DNA_END=325 /DNA_ORIENTATION=+